MEHFRRELPRGQNKVRWVSWLLAFLPLWTVTLQTRPMWTHKALEGEGHLREETGRDGEGSTWPGNDGKRDTLQSHHPHLISWLHSATGMWALFSYSKQLASVGLCGCITFSDHCKNSLTKAVQTRKGYFDSQFAGQCITVGKAWWQTLEAAEMVGLLPFFFF